MRLFWTFSSLPELASLSPRERQRILKNAGAAGPCFWIAARSVFLGVVGFEAAFNGFPNDRSKNLQLVMGAACGLIVASTAMQVQMQIARISMRSQIRRLLRGERVPICLTCGYDQAANVTNRCPECGASIRVPHDHA